jgi:hypothetical protein
MNVWVLAMSNPLADAAFDPGRHQAVGSDSRDVALMQEMASALYAAEFYLDACVNALANVDIATMRQLLHGKTVPERSDARDE